MSLIPPRYNTLEAAVKDLKKHGRRKVANEWNQWVDMMRNNRRRK